MLIIIMLDNNMVVDMKVEHYWHSDRRSRRFGEHFPHEVRANAW